MAERKILVLLDSLVVRREVFSYAAELAKRLKASLYLVVLLPWGSVSPQNLSDSACTENGAASKEEDHVLQSWFHKKQLSRIDVSGTVRRGDPASELLKLLAESPPFQAVIWGGNENFLRQKRIPVRGHWLERIREELGCPLVVPSLKKKSTKKISAYRVYE